MTITKSAIAIVLLGIGLIVGCAFLIYKRGFVSDARGQISRVFENSSAWAKIEPRTEKQKAAAKEAVADKIAVAEKAVAPSQKNSKPSIKTGQPAIKWCDPKNGTDQRKIIFNEIAWMGSQSGYSDEWIELKNISGAAIDLEGWQLQNKSQKVAVSFLSGETLGPGKFYLLERTDDGSASGVVADKIYSGSLGNSNEALYLFDNNCQLQDSVVADKSWLAGDNQTKQTMARLTDLSWKNSLAPGGTPKAENR